MIWCEHGLRNKIWRWPLSGTTNPTHFTNLISVLNKKSTSVEHQANYETQCAHLYKQRLILISNLNKFLFWFAFEIKQLKEILNWISTKKPQKITSYSFIFSQVAVGNFFMYRIRRQTWSIKELFIKILQNLFESTSSESLFY